MADNFNILDLSGLGNPYSSFFWYESKIISGNTLFEGTDTSQYHNYYALQNPGANGDTLEWNVSLEEGNYTLFMLGETDSGSGIIKFQLNGSDIVTGLDWYNAGLQNNIVKSGNFSVSTGDNYALRSIVTGKNASSSGHNISGTRVWIVKQ